MAIPGFAHFDTAIGRCRIAWGEHGVTGVRLPPTNGKASPELTRDTLPPPEVQRAIDDIVALLKGEAADLRDVQLDMDGVPPFHRRVYEVARGIAPGATLTYGEIAARIGEPGSARAVGVALGRNPFPIIVPCHRVLAAGGKAGGFSAPGGVRTKLRLLEIEGALLGPGGDEPQLF
jgi:methylated-DNA-[protein]-cysteine S-methyltransferase